MPTFALIPGRPLRVHGSPRRGWGPATEDDPAGQVLAFRFEITEAGDSPTSGFLLNYESLDGQFCADSWHESLAEAFPTAEEYFGIARPEWFIPTDT